MITGSNEFICSYEVIKVKADLKVLGFDFGTTKSFKRKLFKKEGEVMQQ